MAYQQMTNDELRSAHVEWEAHVENAAGWPSAYFAATQVKQIVAESDRRKLGLINHWPIRTQ